MACASLATGAEIVLVPSSNAGPYIKVKDALVKELDQGGLTTQVVMLSDLGEGEEIQSLIEADPRAFVAIGSKAALWLHKRVTPPTVLTYCMVSNPKGAGLEEGMPRNGISTDVPLTDQFKLIAEALPDVRSVGLLYHAKTKEGQTFLKQVKAGLPKGWKIQAVAVDEHKTMALAIDALFAKDSDIVWTSPDSSIFTRATVHSLLLKALREKVPVFGFSLALVKSGSLLGVAVDVETQGKQAAALTRHLLRAGDETEIEELLKVKYEIAVNLIVAEQMSIKLPKQLVKRADHVFKP
jgi:putative ABC transport system substrate-binding protein